MLKIFRNSVVFFVCFFKWPTGVGDIDDDDDDLLKLCASSTIATQYYKSIK